MALFQFGEYSFWIQISNLSLKWMNQRVGEIIGDKQGCFEAVEVDKKGNSWGRFSCGVLEHSEKSYCGNSGKEEESQYGLLMKAREPRKDDRMRNNIIVWRDRTSDLAKIYPRRRTVCMYANGELVCIDTWDMRKEAEDMHETAVIEDVNIMARGSDAATGDSGPLGKESGVLGVDSGLLVEAE
nr:uncharacterized protein LOC108980746 [Ipomoea batatas]